MFGSEENSNDVEAIIPIESDDSIVERFLLRRESQFVFGDLEC